MNLSGLSRGVLCADAQRSHYCGSCGQLRSGDFGVATALAARVYPAVARLGVVRYIG
jgi:hypothetical protein